MRYLIKILVIIALFGCEKEKVNQPPVFGTLSIDIYSDSIRFETNIISKGSLPIREYGFVISTINPPKLGNNLDITLNDSLKTDRFSASMQNKLDSALQYFVAGYIKTDEGTVYGDYVLVKGNDRSPTITGEWYSDSDLDIDARYGAVSFVIDDKIYICSGYNGNGGTKKTFRDLSVYDESADSWWPLASMPAAARARRGAVAFAVNGKGYVGLGLAEDGLTFLKDFWAYDPIANEWSQIADFAGNARSGAMAFAINNKGYVGNGIDDQSYYKDFYEYNETDNVWKARPSIPPKVRTNPFVFVIDGKAYLGGGRNNGALVKTFYEFDPTQNETGKWIAKNDLQDDNIDNDPNDAGYSTLARDQAVTFVIAGQGYIVGGTNSMDTWQYDPAEDRWYKVNSFEGPYRYGAIGYTIGNFGYVASGFSGSATYFSDKWKFDPIAVDK